MLKSNCPLENINTSAQVSTSLIYINEILNFKYHWTYILNVFKDDAFISEQSRIIDECLKQIYKTDYIVSIIDDDNLPLIPNKTHRFCCEIYEGLFTLRIADVFPDRKTLNLYKLSYPEIYNNNYRRLKEYKIKDYFL